MLDGGQLSLNLAAGVSFCLSIRGFCGRNAPLQRHCWEGRPFIIIATGWREQSLEISQEVKSKTFKASVAKSSHETFNPCLSVSAARLNLSVFLVSQKLHLLLPSHSQDRFQALFTGNVFLSQQQRRFIPNRRASAAVRAAAGPGCSGELANLLPDDAQPCAAQPLSQAECLSGRVEPVLFVERFFFFFPQTELFLHRSSR